jgi:hypothetical protein
LQWGRSPTPAFLAPEDILSIFSMHIDLSISKLGFVIFIIT